MKLAQLDFNNAAVGKLPGVETDLSGTTDRGLGGLLSGLLSALMVIAAITLLFYLIWGAYDWISSAGDSSKVQKARDKMTQAVLGLIVLAATLAIFSLLMEFLGINTILFI